MKKIFISVFAALAALTACQEWEPVVTFNYKADDSFVPVTREQMDAMGDSLSIAALLSRYKPGSETPVEIYDDVWISGKVASSDKSGNIYKSIYIQDATGGVEVKIGRYSLYNEYEPGQTVYVYMRGLTLGMYGYSGSNGNGMVQIGLYDPMFDIDKVLGYETAYMELQKIVDNHVFRGKRGPAVEPAVLEASMLPGKDGTVANCKYIGQLVTIKNLVFDKQSFTLVYITYNESTKTSGNRIFLSDKTWGVNTWAMSKNKMSSYLESGIWDEVKIGNSGDYNYGTVGSHKMVFGSYGDIYGDIQRNAYSVSQYFKTGSKTVQIRTSGYSDFADYEIPADVFDGSRAIDATGILTMYQGSVQLSLIDQFSLKYNDNGKNLYKE